MLTFLLKGGEPDLKAVSKIVISDWQRGEIPYFVLPPNFRPGKKLKKDEPTAAVIASEKEEEHTKIENSNEKPVETALDESKN